MKLQGPPRDRASTLRRHAHAGQERVNALNKLRQVVSCYCVGRERAASLTAWTMMSKSYGLPITS
jgi:hypothetical protein